MCYGIEDFIYIDNTKEYYTKTTNEILKEICDTNIEFKIHDNVSFIEKAIFIREKVYKKRNKGILNKLLYKKIIFI